MFPASRPSKKSKECVKTHIATKRVAQIQFRTMDAEEMHKMSVIEICKREMYTQPSRTPALFGCLDTRLGTSQKDGICQTCNKTPKNCEGHFGFVRLMLPVFHVGYFKHTMSILQCICKTCSRVLLPPEKRGPHLKKLRNPLTDSLAKQQILKTVIMECKKNSVCPYCFAPNGVVKKLPNTALKILHDLYRAKRSEEALEEIIAARQTAFEIHHPELMQHVRKMQETITPLRAYELLSNMTKEDAEILWMNPVYGRPEELIITHILVPPNAIRPTVTMESGTGSNEDDITVKLQEIIEVNQLIAQALRVGTSFKRIIDDWDMLQMQVALLINADTPGLPKIPAAKPIRGYCQRLKGKQGRFRGNLSGKRVDFTSRTVISPDPNLRVDQVGCPVYVAKILTYPEKVNRYNIAKLRRAVRNGANVHPGAVRVRSKGGETQDLRYMDLELCACSLQIGDTVDRHMADGDIVLFNRQPSLHKMSIMAHRVKVMPWKTFRFNECVCSPYNADFDGDEMNVHLPQTEEAKAEAEQLMGVTHNLVSPRNGEPLVAATQDFLTGAYLITAKDVFLDREHFCAIVAYLGDGDEHIELPPPAIIKPCVLWTGKQIISLLVKPNTQCRCNVNLDNTERNYKKGFEVMCPDDGYTCFRNGELMCGTPGKKTLGADGKHGLFYMLIRNFGAEEATRCMNRLAKLCARYLGYHRGFSIGIDDVTPSHEMAKEKEIIVRDGNIEADNVIQLYNSAKLKLKPGCDALQSLENDINGILSKIRETCGKSAMSSLPWNNAPRIMADSGSKGSPLNISQMMACVGQQNVSGKRIENGFVNRTLPHFANLALEPSAKGFVENSFYSGLTATEFFFHTMGGREGLVDTAVKTAETGYMSRRLMKSMEDLSIQYDFTVRSSEQNIVQFLYGDDGLNPRMMESGDRPVDFKKLFHQVQADFPCHDEPPLTSEDIVAFGKYAVLRPEFQKLPSGDKPSTAEDPNPRPKFFSEIEQFCELLAKPLADLELECGLTDMMQTHANTHTNENIYASLRERLAQLSQAQKREWQVAAAIQGSQQWKESMMLVCWNVYRVTRTQLEALITRALDRYHRAIVEPGEAVGAVGAQSVGEPGTQMTLKTFHFAGVASHNVTLGVPRVIEIINATKIIKTPFITAKLLQNDSEIVARIVKGKIEKTTLGQVTLTIAEMYTPELAYLEITLDLETIERLYLDINAFTVRRSILRSGPTVKKKPVLKLLKEHHLLIPDGRDDQIRVLAPEPPKSAHLDNYRRKYFTMQHLKAALPEVIVHGVPSISRAIINVDEKAERVANEARYYLAIEGHGLADVIGIPGVDGARTRTNHVAEMESVLGIEAARETIVEEMLLIMDQYGIAIDRRHLMLMADVMCSKGIVLGITRFGVGKMRESVLMLASFETPTEHLFDAAVHKKTDKVSGVTECVIMGMPIGLGTGLFKLIQAGTLGLMGKARRSMLEVALKTNEPLFVTNPNPNDDPNPNPNPNTDPSLEDLLYLTNPTT